MPSNNPGSASATQPDLAAELAELRELHAQTCTRLVACQGDLKRQSERWASCGLALEEALDAITEFLRVYDGGAKAGDLGTPLAELRRLVR